jgi:hypothetical protein
MTIIGETTDDAVGEAFDKSAKYNFLPVVLWLIQHAQFVKSICIYRPKTNIFTQ